jgi:alpha-D-xyloside xylohydrolase
MISENNEERVDIALDGIEGFESAIESILESAKLGYNIIGSDVAGFSGSTIPPRLYMRWTQFSTFCGLFMNGGHGDRRLWKRTEEELKVIRKFSWLHTELVPYMYHYVVTAHNGGRRLQTVLDKGKYQYMFGDDFLVTPIYVDSKTREVSLPKGEWRYFFNDTELLEGKSTFKREYPLDEFPVFIKEGAIIPMNIEREYTNIGDENSKGFTTILVYPKGENSFTFYHTDTKGKTEISYVFNESNNLKVNLEGKKIPHILTIQSMIDPKKITLEGEQLLRDENWKFDIAKQKIIIKTKTYSKGNYEINY